MVPLSVPTLAWCDATTFTSDACHTDLHTNRQISVPATECLWEINVCFCFRNKSLPKLSSSCFVLDNLVPDRKHDNSSGTVRTPTMAEDENCNAYSLHDYREVKLSRTFTRIRRLYLRVLVFSATHMTELAAAAAPVFLVLVRGPLCWFKAKHVERLTAYLAMQHLQK